MAADTCELCHDLIPGKVTCWDREGNPICLTCYQDIEDRMAHYAHEAACRTDDLRDVS